MTIQIYRKNVYGQELIYIRDANQAESIQKLTKQKTLSTQDKMQLETLGIKFEEVLAPKHE